MNKKGFTLLESLFSIILLSIMLVGGIRLFFYADQVTSLAIHKKMATEIVNSKMEALRNIPYDQIVGDAGQQGEVFIGGLVPTIDVIVEEVDEDGQMSPPAAFKRVNVRIAWNEPGENPFFPRIYELVSYICCAP